MKILLTAVNAKYIHSNPAIYSLKAYADTALANYGALNNTRSNCANSANSVSISSSQPDSVIVIREYTINNLIDDILDDIYSEKPDVIAFSCYIWNIAYINILIPELKKLLPHTDIWCGGPEVSYRAKEFIAEHVCCITGVIVGEGEATFSELAKTYTDTASNCKQDATRKPNTTLNDKPNATSSLLTDSQLNSIYGIVYRNQDEDIIATPARMPIDMDSIPFLYDSLNDFEHRIIYYESSRGCPFSCSYCLSSIDKTLRYRSLPLVKRELDFFIKNRVPQVKFIDRTFNCNRERATEIWQYIYDNDNGITNFHFEIAADLLNDTQIELLRHFRPGLVQFEIGVQSTNLSTLKEIHRSSNLELLAENVEKIRLRNNIHQHLDLIAGLPHEDIDSFRQSFNQVYNMQPDQLQLGFLKVLSGSYIKEHTTDYGIVYRDYPPYEVLFTSCLNRDDMLLLKSIENMVEIYYNSHQFDNSIRYLETYFESPFNLYENLGAYYEKCFDTKAKHSRISRYNLLLDFYKSISGSHDDTDFKKRLTLDVYLRENIKSRPEFANDLNPYRKHITELKRKYNMSNHEHIEVFVSDSGEPVYVHFDYEHRNPLTHDASLHRLSL